MACDHIHHLKNRILKFDWFGLEKLQNRERLSLYNYRNREKAFETRFLGFVLSQKVFFFVEIGNKNGCSVLLHPPDYTFVCRKINLCCRPAQILISSTVRAIPGADSKWATRRLHDVSAADRPVHMATDFCEDN